MSENPHATLDVIGEESPTPVIRTKDALDTLSAGQILKVLTSKQSAIDNIQTLSANNPFTILSEEKVDDHFVVLIQKN